MIEKNSPEKLNEGYPGSLDGKDEFRIAPPM
jgi:hypothetical protein